MATRKKKNDDGKLAVGLGAAAVAAAAAGAGYYFYASKNAKKHRQAASKWATGLKRETVKRVKALKKIDASAIANAVDEVAELYEGVRGVSAADLRAATKELKKNWKMLQGEAAGSAKRAVTRAKGTAKKATTKKRTSTKKRA